MSFRRFEIDEAHSSLLGSVQWDAALFEQIRAAAKGLLATRKKGDNVDAFAKLLAENAGEMKVAKVVTGLGPAPQAKANL